MNKIRLVLLLCIVILFGNGWCLAEKDAAVECPHQWSSYDEDVHGILPEEIELFAVNDLQHAYMRRWPKQVCAMCGERVFGYGEGSYTPHAYTVTDWHMTEDGVAASITLTCGVCEHVYTYEVTIQTLREKSGKNCLEGGWCDTLIEGLLFENGMILFDTKGHNLPYGFDPGEPIYESMVVYDPVKKTFLATGREYCPTCGRPRTYRFTPQSDFDPKWNGRPIMTMEYFLTNGVPENLPYQLLDQLRQETSGA